MISVLINNHNYGQYVGEAIESVLNQTYQDFEIIVRIPFIVAHFLSSFLLYVSLFIILCLMICGLQSFFQNQ